MLQLFWNWLAYLGVSTAKNTAEHKHIILVNGLCIVIQTYLVLTIPSLFLIEQLPIVFAIVPIFYSASLVAVLALNNRGHTRAARITLVVTSFLLMVCNSILTRGEANFHFFLLTEMLAVFFIFPSDEGRFMYPAATLALFTFLVFHFTPAQLLIPSWLPKADIDFSEFKKTSAVGTATLIFAFCFYIQRTFRVADRILAAEKDKSERLLLNILPSPIVKQLKERPNTIAERFEECSVLFSDIVGFTNLTRSMPAVDVVSHLNTIFSAFDDLADHYGLEKIKTIGDAYMVVGGLPKPDPEHAEKIAHFALDILDVVQDYRERTNLPLELRIGINSGDAVAGVIGKRKFIYDLWGDSVNTASRMESHGLPGKIQVTESTYQLIQSKFEFNNRGTIDVKGIGPVQSYILISKNNL